MSIAADIRQWVNQTPFVDTHEHLLEETTRLNPPTDRHRLQTQTDFSVLFSQYADSDLVVAGMPKTALDTLARRDVEPREKWQLVAPYYASARWTGYLQNVRESVRLLYDEDDITADNCETISDRIAADIKPGYYAHILRNLSNIEHCQVNSLETALFNETQHPDILCQDMSFVPLSTGLNIDDVAQRSGINVRHLHDWHSAIDWCFATYGPRAIAVKNQSAYWRSLNIANIDTATAEPLFARYLDTPNSLTENEQKALEDHLFNYCVQKSSEYALPVKLHTGYFAGSGYMPLHRLRHHAGDLCTLAQRYPEARFVVMHITYPYQDEAIALAKHYPNVWIDMCWAWIINPLASIRFVKEFLMAVPANKLLTFGADYMPIELVPGHAAIARQGLTQAIRELVEEGWIDIDAAPALITMLMRGNAHALFDYSGTLAAW